MQPSIERIMFTWNLMARRTADATREAKASVTDYLQSLRDGGETDPDRLAVFGLTHLRKLQLQPVRIRR